ncbi:MAG: DUF2752 domain-containing protein [Saprospiraceae bacterium]|nr:DUF2752 domain-containing protein [Saprospiraceae bacterium]
MNKNSYFISTLKLAGFSILIITLLLMPADFFDTGTPVCLFTRLSGYSCYGCGMTRAMMHLLHLNFAIAWNYNKLSFIVFPLLVFVFGKWYWKELNQLRIKH